MFISKNDLKAWWDSPHFSKMRQNLNDSLECPRDFCERQSINWVPFIRHLLSSPLFTKVAVFPSPVLASWAIPHKDGSTCIPLATSDPLHPFSQPMFPHILSPPPHTLLCLEAPWPFVLIEHLDHSGEGTGVGVKKQAHVWMMVLLLGG